MIETLIAIPWSKILVCGTMAWAGVLQVHVSLFARMAGRPRYALAQMMVGWLCFCVAFLIALGGA